MKMRFSLRSLSLLALLLTLGCCKKDKDDPKPIDKLPAATTSGANTCGCLVNGEAWTSSGADNMRADWTVSNYCSGNMSFSTRFISIGIKSGFVAGDYDITPPPAGPALARVSIGSKMYPAANIMKGHLVLTRLDRQAGVMAGTFEFVMVGGPGDTLRVTDGRFDIGNMDR